MKKLVVILLVLALAVGTLGLVACKKDKGGEQSATGSYMVLWKNYDGTVIKADENVPAGTVPSYEGTVPSHPADSEYTYTFKGWDPAPAAIDGNATYTAQFDTVPKEDETPKTFTVEWVDYDGTGIAFTKDVPAGTTPVFSGKTPTRKGYVFEGWEPTPAPISADTTYTAVYSQLDFEVTAVEYAVALAFAGNFTAEFSLFSDSLTFYQLDDGSYELIGKIHDVFSAYLALKRDDGDFDCSVTSAFDSDGNAYFPGSEVYTAKEAEASKLNYFLIGLYLPQVKYTDLTYDADKGEYGGAIKLDGENMYVTVKFENKRLVKASMIGEGAKLDCVFSNYGTTVLPDEESFRAGVRGCALNVTDEEDYMDLKYLELPSGKAGDELKFDLFVNVGDLPEGFDSTKDKISVGALAGREYVDDQDKEQDEEYTDDYLDLEIAVFQPSAFDLANYWFDNRSGYVTKHGNGLQANLCNYGYLDAVGKGTYRLVLTVTLKKDLKEGQNYVAVASELKKALAVSLTADQDSGYDADATVPLAISKKGESIQFDLTAVFEVPADYDPTNDHFVVDVELVDEDDVYYSDDEYKVTMTYADRDITEYLTSAYKYRGRLTQAEGSFVSLPAGTYVVNITVELNADLPDKDFNLIVAINIYE